MKTASLLLLGLLLFQSASYAQTGRSGQRSTQRETVIINKNNSGTTSIEIREDGVYVDGEQVATRAELGNRNLNKRIVVQNGNRDDFMRDYDDYFNRGRERNQTGRRGMLGVFTDARRSGDGAYIERISPGSAAAEAGLREGDIIIRVDSSNIYNAADLSKTIRNYDAGERVTITYNRNGRERQTTATLGEAREEQWSRIYDYNDGDAMPVPPVPPMPPMPDRYPSDESRLDERPKLGVTAEDAQNGVAIRTVRAGSLADAAGLRSGDVITYINDNKVDNVEELQRQVQGAQPGSKMKVEISRNGARLTKTVQFPRTNRSRDL